MKSGVLLVVLGLCVTSGVGTLLAEVSAKTWLRSHAAPQQDDLAELKTENPEAYGLVEALLTKRSLGLLDPQHPTASFQASAAKKSDEPSGVAAYAALTTPKDEEIEARSESAASAPESAAEAPESAVEAPPHHHIANMFNWRPQAAATDDDTAVQNVLGAAAQLAPVQPAELGGSSLAADAGLLADEAAAPAAVATQASPAEAPPQPAGENSYLKGLNLNGMTSNKASSGADLNADAKLFDASDAGEDVKAKAPETPAPQAAATPDALSSWLGVKKVVKKAQQAAAVPVKPSNPYAVDWNN